jgi:hypothetical protein
MLLKSQAEDAAFALFCTRSPALVFTRFCNITSTCASPHQTDFPYLNDQLLTNNPFNKERPYLFR